jgi:hypothetical protein
MSAGNQAAVQGDTSANLRINPYGPIGAFANVVSTGTVTATQVLTVPGSTKWAIKTLVFDAIPSNTVTKQARIWIADAAGNLMWEYGNASFTPTNTLTYRHYFLPIVVNTATYTASVAGTATQQLQAVIPDLVLGPGCTINGALLGAAGTATYSLRANVHAVSD